MMLSVSTARLMKLPVLALAATLVHSANFAHAAWNLIDDFEGRAVGSLIDGTFGPGATWDGGGLAHTAAADPDNATNGTMQVTGAPGNSVLRAQISSASGRIADQATGTLYYRFRTPVAANGTTDHVIGLTDNPAITNFNFKSGLRNVVNGTPSNQLDARDQGATGGDYQPVANLQDDTWYSLWMVSNNTSPGGTHEIYIQSDTDANFAAQTQMASIANANTSFAYRIDDPSEIVNVYFRNAANNGGVAGNDLYFDDIWMNGDTADLSFPGGGLAGDFDGDVDVDGADFLAWQRTDGTSGGLADWQNGYPNPLSASSAASAVPEPGSLCLLAVGAVALRVRRRLV